MNTPFPTPYELAMLAMANRHYDPDGFRDNQHHVEEAWILYRECARFIQDQKAAYDKLSHEEES